MKMNVAAAIFVISTLQFALAYEDQKCEIKYDVKCDEKCKCIEKKQSGTKVYQFFMSIVGKATPCDCDKMCTKVVQLPCVHGVCMAENKSCKCDSCWTGRGCDQYENKHKPVFSKRVQEHFLPADSSIGSVVSRVHATDADTKKCMKHQDCPCAQIQYAINEKRSGYAPFAVDAHSGEIVVDGVLTDSKYSLVIEAKNNDDRHSIEIEEDYPAAILHITLTGMRKPKVQRTAHHMERRAIATSHSLVLAVIPQITTTFYFDRGESIVFDLNMYHNASVSAQPSNAITITLSSDHLTLTDTGVTGTIDTKTMNGDSLELTQSASLGSSDTISLVITTTVKNTINALDSLYLNCSYTATIVSGGDTIIDDALSTPVVYGVYPTVNFTAPGGNALTVYGAPITFNVKLCMPNMDMPLLLEITSNIESFLFLELASPTVGSTPASLTFGTTPSPVSHSSTTFYGTDRIVIDFGAVTINDMTDPCVEIDFQLKADDNPMLADGSSHWFGIGLQTGDRVLLVEQTSVTVTKVEPTLQVAVSSSTVMNSSRVYIGDTATVDFEVSHTNLSGAPASNIQLYMITSLWTPTTNGANQLDNINATHYKVKLSGVTTPQTLPNNNDFTGGIELEVIQDVSPLASADIAFLLTYENSGGKKKLPREDALAPLIGTPSFLLTLNAVDNNIRQGEKRLFTLDILITKLKTPAKIELIMQSEDNESLFHLNMVRVVSIGTNLVVDTPSAAPVLAATGENPEINDMATIDFGSVINTNADTTDIPDNKIQIEFEAILNCHSNITNGSRYWVGAGMYGEPKMIWVGQISMYPYLSANPRPWLQLVPEPIVSGSLAIGDTFQYHVNISHKTQSECFAHNLTARFFIPGFIDFVSVDAGAPDIMITESPSHLVSFKFPGVFIFPKVFEFTFNVKVSPARPPPEGTTEIATRVYLTYFDSDGEDYTLVKAAKTPINIPVTPTLPPPIEGSKPEYYPRGFAWNDATNPSVIYACGFSNGEQSKPCCYSTKDDGITFKSMDIRVCSIIGHDSNNNIHGVSHDGKTYIKFIQQRDRWTSINEQEFQADSPPSHFLKVNGNLASGDPTGAGNIKTFSGGKEWGVSADGVYHKPNGGTWTLVAKWECSTCM